jgi:hypothetical protein
MEQSLNFCLELTQHLLNLENFKIGAVLATSGAGSKTGARRVDSLSGCVLPGHHQ